MFADGPSPQQRSGLDTEHDAAAGESTRMSMIDPVKSPVAEPVSVSATALFTSWPAFRYEARLMYAVSIVSFASMSASSSRMLSFVAFAVKTWLKIAARLDIFEQALAEAVISEHP